MNKSKIIMGSCVWGLTVATGLAVGFRLPNQDPDGIARGNAFVATADNPSAIYYNPAGITQMDGYLLRVGLYNISTGIDVTSVGGKKSSADSSFQTVPQIYFVASPEDSPWSYGVGLYAPYGLGIDYGGDTSFSTIAREGALAYVSFNPVVAYEVNECLSVAAGITFNYSDLSISRNITNPGDRFDFEADGGAIGYTLGVLWQPHKKWSFGLSYRSQTKVDYDGYSRIEGFVPIPALNGKSDTSASLVFPMYIDVGASYRPNEKWNIEVNVDWTDWNSVNQSVLKGAQGGDQIFPFHYDSSFMYELGVTRYFDHGYYLSMGYIYSENSVPDQTLTPLNPDANLHLGSIGIGRKMDDISWAIAYHFAYNGGRKVTNNVSSSFIGETANGKYKTLNHAVNLSLTYQF